MKEKNYFFASEQDVYSFFENNPGERMILAGMHSYWKQRLLDYMTGKKTLPFTYDPFFKLVFNGVHFVVYAVSFVFLLYSDSNNSC